MQKVGINNKEEKAERLADQQKYRQQTYIRKKQKCKRYGKQRREEKIKRYEVVYRYLFTMVLESGWTNIMEWNL